MKNPTQRRHPTAQRQQQIARAALRILAQEGAAGLTAKRIGREVGISDGAVFKHYPNKPAILEAAITTFEQLLESPVISSDQTPLERLGAFFLDRVTRVRANPEILSLAFSGRLEMVASEDGAERVRLIMGRSVAFVRRCLSEGQKRGEIRDTASPEILTWMVVGALRAAATQNTGRKTPKRVWSEVRATLRR